MLVVLPFGDLESCLTATLKRAVAGYLWEVEGMENCCLASPSAARCEATLADRFGHGQADLLCMQSRSSCS